MDRKLRLTANPLAVLEELHLRYRDCREGRVADYIPELAKANPDWFGICFVTSAGQVCAVGDADRHFTIQSMSKPFIYGLALEDHGRETVLERVGVEPTGDAFNSIIKLDSTNRAHNPMVNAGAIATSDLISGRDPTERLNRVLDLFRRYAGRDLTVDMSVFLSERTTGHRNRAIAQLMLNFGMIGSNVEETLDLYFQQCSIMVTARDMATMAATLANRGVNPVTGERAVAEEYVRDVLTVMYTCGLYDSAGRWAYDVGLPAKSGVSGGLFAVVPGQLGICVFSPPLDERGSSVRGIRVCEDLSRNAGMHLFDAWRQAGPILDRTNEPASESSTSPQAARVDDAAESPAQLEMLAAINEVHRQLAGMHDGAVADYIPELAKADPDAFAISVAMVDGTVCGVGDIDQRFTLQSVASPFVYGHVLETLGREEVRKIVGVEPTGNPFNAIILDRHSRRPMNPMVNAGAIAVTSLVPGDDPTQRLDSLLSMFTKYLGHRPEVDLKVFESEKSTGDRNRAIAYLMRNFGSLSGPLDETLDLYFRQCSLLTTSSDLAMMAATLANGGVNPSTGARAIGLGPLRDVLTILCTCGLFEVSGRWAYEAGLPSKSGVSGAFMAVVPGRLGIAVYSPRLDAVGNSLRGLLACKLLSQRLGLHMLS